MIKIIKTHMEKYPKMQLQDVAKLLYQSEFGGGHMIADPEHSLLMLRSEHEKMSCRGEKLSFEDMIEDIGDGMCRIYLSCLDHGLRAEVLNDIFVQCANHKTGDALGLEQKIEIFLRACEEKELPFEFSEAKEYMQTWKEKGYCMMRHSELYRETYQPAYRVAENTYVRAYEIILEIMEKKPKVVAIEGMSASGKTTLGELLHKNFPESNLFHTDDYFLQPHQRTEQRLREVGGNLDYERFKEEIVMHLEDPNGICYRRYDCSTQELGAAVCVPYQPLTIIEGAYSHHPYFGNYYDIGVFCKISAEEQERRIKKRNGEKMWDLFKNVWIPLENEYFINWGRSKI